MNKKGLRVEFQLPSQRKAKGAPPAPVKDPVPRIARLLALAHKWEGMVRRSEVKDYAEIALLTDLTRARVSQICNLALLSPWFQEGLLSGECNVPERKMRQTAVTPLWEDQKHYHRTCR